MSNLSLQELKQLYEKKCEECNLAGTIGQMLLQENEEVILIHTVETAVATVGEFNTCGSMRC
jgi:methylthioribose-1-phosphate isomerase